MNKLLLTYFTPTYNREKLLPKLYESLLSQTNKNFIWLIIDDGSKDNTESLINKWKSEQKINIEYIKKENGGKHTAIDLSNQLCTTEYISCIDSDDYITPNCTEVLYDCFDELSKNTSAVGLVGRRDLIGFEDHKITAWPQNKSFLYFHELSEKYNFNYDTILVFKTSIIKQYSFPVFADERFVTECVFYNKFMFDYTLMAIEDYVYIGEYQPDGYTSMGMNLFLKNPKGYLCFLKQAVWLAITRKLSFKQKLKKTMQYYGWKKILKQKQNFMPEYKIPCFYKIVGTLLSPISKIILTKKHNLKKTMHNA